jgi:cell division protein FtsL
MGQGRGGWMKVLRLIAMCLVVVFFTNGCLVTKKVYKNLVREKAVLDIERQELRRELAEKDDKIAEQGKRITTLEQDVMDLQIKYEDYMKVAKERLEELAKSVLILREQSSEEIRVLLNQIEELREKYEKYREAKDEEIDGLKAGHTAETPSLDQEKSLDGLLDQLEQQLREEIEKGDIRLKRYKTKIK